MNTQTLVLLAISLRSFLAEQKYIQETKERIERLEILRLNFSASDLSVRGN